MSFILQPGHILLVATCRLVSQQIIDFQNAEIEALSKKLGRKRPLLNDDQRRLWAVRSHAIGPVLCRAVQHTPATLSFQRTNTRRDVPRNQKRPPQDTGNGQVEFRELRLKTNPEQLLVHIRTSILDHSEIGST